MRVVTFNILNGGIGREHLILDILRTIQADLILLQEVVHSYVIDDFAQQLGMKAIMSGGQTHRHVAILSRYPILNWQSLTTIPRIGRGLLAATIECKPEQLINVFCVHLTSQPYLPFEWIRLLEVNSLLKYTGSESSVPCLIAGDFNSISPNDTPALSWFPTHLQAFLLLQGNYLPRRVISRMLRAGFVDCYRVLHTEPGFTLPPPNPTVRYDYIFANDLLHQSLLNCSVMQFPSVVGRASDHYPVMAEFNL